MKPSMILLAVFVFLAVTSSAQQVVTVSDLNRNKLLQYCVDGDISGRNFCIGYIEGIRDGSVFATVNAPKPMFTIPDDVNGDQLKDIVVKYLKANPEIRHKAAGMLVIFALREAFPTSS